MRNLALSLSLIVAIAACGPSNKEITGAKTARYTGDKATLFAAAKAATEAKYELAKVDEASLGFQTKPKWFTPEGIIAPGNDEDIKDVPDKSIRLTLVVRLLPDGSNWIVQVDASMLRRIAGSPQPEPVKLGDPSVPGYAQNMTDQLQYDIWTAMKPYEVKSATGPMPAAAPAAAPAPAADPAAAPAPAAPAAPAQ
ncbi:MAG TPA: hypothetical protein VGM90_31765 [Kofleriaceae bacterium]|jgi:hypothetical protein